MREEQEKILEKERQRLLAFFEEPEYVPYEIEYVTDATKADVFISKNHIAFDYLTIGFTCLAKQASGNEERKIYVAYRNYTSMEMAKVHDFLFPPKYGGKSLPTTSLTDAFEKICEVLNRYYKNPQVYNGITGLTFASYATSVAMGYAEDPDIDLEFKNFNETVYAQKLAFENIKRHVISTSLGAMYQLFWG